MICRLKLVAILVLTLIVASQGRDKPPTDAVVDSEEDRALGVFGAFVHTTELAYLNKTIDYGM